jgi:coenzyme F420 biosynthesis associated uncharacterized protein
VSYLGNSLRADFHDVTREAEQLVAESTGLRAPGTARAQVVDRAAWVSANVSSMRKLLAPLTARVGARMANSPVAPLGRRVAGTETGMLLGYLAQRVLGQYDLLVVDDEPERAADAVYYVGGNILALETRFAFRPRDFRLWIAVHEVTHRAQFTGVPWMREHFLSLVEGSLAGVDPDPKRFVAALRRAVDEVRAGRNPLDEGGLVALLASPEQHALLQKIQGLMSLLEGHGDITMNRAAAEAIPSADRFARTLRQRRNATGIARHVQKLIGLEAKLIQYEQGERFIETVEAAGGRETLDLVWRGPEWLPTLPEIREPQLWLARVRAAELAAR